jgi:WXG100 family type VII secretion target
VDINGAIAGKVAKVLSLLDLPWPGGDPAALRGLAGSWRAMGGELEQTAEHLNVQVSLVVGAHWQGAAADAFQAHWQQQHQGMVKSAQAFQQVATELDAYADQAEQIIEAIVDIALQIAEFELAGAFLTVVTAGISDAVAAAASGERALKIVQLIDKFIKMAERAERVVTELIEEIRSLGTLPRILVDGLKNFAGNLAGTQLGNLMSGKGLVQGSDVETAALSGFGAAGLGGAAFKLGSKLDSSSKISQFLTGDGLEGGAAATQSVVMGGLTSAAGGAIADGVEGNGARATGADVVTDGIAGALGAGRTWAGQSTAGASGKHAAPLTPISSELGAFTGVNGEGGALEGAVNQNPTLPKQDQGADGAVVVSQ